MWRGSRCARASAPFPSPAHPGAPPVSAVPPSQAANDFGRLIYKGRERDALAAFVKLTAPTKRESELAFFAARKVGDVRLMERLYDTLPAAIGPRATTALMATHAAKGNLTRVIELLRSQGPQPSIYAYTTALSALGRAGKINEMEAMMAEVEALPSVKPTAAFYTVALNTYAHSERYSDALQVWNRMRLRGVLPDELTYNALLLVCAKSGKLAEAKNLQAEIEGRRMTLTATMCISMISTCVTASQLGEADLWLQRIRTMHQSASMFAYETYTTALTALWRREHSPVLLQRVLLLLDEVRADTRLQASRVLLTNALSAAAKSRDGPAAVRIVALFDSLQYPRDAILLASFLEVYVRTKRIDDAAALFQEMKADKKVSVAAYKMMVGLYADVRQLDRAREVFEEAKSVDMATKATYREIIGACMRCGNAELARTYEEEERANAHRLK